MERTKELLSNREMLDSLTQVVDALGSGIGNLLQNQPPEKPSNSQETSPSKSPSKHNFARMISRAKDETRLFLANNMNEILQRLQKRFQYFDETITVDINSIEDDLNLTEKLAQRRRCAISQQLKRRFSSNVDVSPSTNQLEKASLDASSPHKYINDEAGKVPVSPQVIYSPHQTNDQKDTGSNVDNDVTTTIDLKSEVKGDSSGLEHIGEYKGNLEPQVTIPRSSHVLPSEHQHLTQEISGSKDESKNLQATGSDFDAEIEADLARNQNQEF